MVGYSEIGDEVDRKRGTTGLRAAFELPAVRSARGEEMIDCVGTTYRATGLGRS
jgi:hypothetical protein